MTRPFTLLIFAAIVALCGCSQSTVEKPMSDDRPPAAEPSKNTGVLPRLTYVGAKKETGTVIVFVHGFWGDGAETWKDASAKDDFLTLVSNDPDFSEATVASYWYKTGPLMSVLTLEEHARHMTEVLKAHNLQSRPLVFVAHSMGGLLVRQLLLSYPMYAEHVQMILFIGTPFAGSALATLASGVSDNPDIQRMLAERGTHDWLDEQQAHWVEVDSIRKIPTYAAYETSAIAKYRIVDEESGGRGSSRKIIPIVGTHQSICKPISRESMIYMSFRNYFMETSPEINNQGVKPFPSKDTCRNLIEQYGGSQAKVLRADGSSPKQAKRDIELTINNGSVIPVCVLLCDAAALYPDPGSKDGHFASPILSTPTLKGSSRKAGHYLDKFHKPTGWYLVFLRFRKENGEVTDKPLGLVDLFETLDPYINISHTVDVNDPVTAKISGHVSDE